MNTQNDNNTTNTIETNNKSYVSQMKCNRDNLYMLKNDNNMMNLFKMQITTQIKHEHINLKKHLFNEKQLIFLNMLIESNISSMIDESFDFINDEIDLYENENEKFIDCILTNYTFNRIDEIVYDLQKSQFVCLHQCINNSFVLISINYDFEIDITNNRELLQYVKTHNCELQIDLSYDVEFYDKN